MITVALAATLLAIAVPGFNNAADGMRLNSATREVERELQTGRLKAVSSNRTLRVRLNCPAARQYRIIEVTGATATDTAVNRCDPNAFGYPGPRDSDAATPAHDGPVRAVHSSITITGPDLQFAPDGTTMTVVSGAPQAIASPVTVTLAKGARTSTVSVNGFGRIQIQ